MSSKSIIDFPGDTWEPGPRDPPKEWPYQYVAKADYDVLAARLAEAERDARRYRWLRSPESAVAEICNSAAPKEDGFVFKEGEDLDAAVDAALAAQEDKS